MVKMLSSLVVAVGILAAAGTASADRRVEIRVREAPPAIRVEHVRERPGYFWVNGDYTWRHGRYVWHRGHWERHRRNYDYVPGRWEQREDHYIYIRPAWRHR